MNLQNAGLAVGAGATAVGWGVVDAVTASLFNVRASTIIMSFFGAALSHAWNTDEEAKKESKKKMYVGILANTLFSATVVGFLPHAMAWDWYSPKLEGSMAFLVAIMSRIAVPLLFKSLPEFIRKILRIGEYNPNKKDSNENQL